jgi:hypothetical protein
MLAGQSFHHACAGDIQEALDVCVCGGFGGFMLCWDIFTWHVVHFQVDVLFF